MDFLFDYYILVYIVHIKLFSTFVCVFLKKPVFQECWKREVRNPWNNKSIELVEHHELYKKEYDPDNVNNDDAKKYW